MTRYLNTIHAIACALTLSLALSGCAELFDDVFDHPTDSESSSDSVEVLGDQLGGDTSDDLPPVAADDPPPVNDVPAATPEPPAPVEPAIPAVDATLNSATVRVFIVGGTMSVSVEADWSATGAADLLVDLEVLSSITYRAWTPVLVNQSPVYFESATLAATQGERRFDFRIVAHDTAGNEWFSNTITVQ